MGSEDLGSVALPLPFLSCHPVVPEALALLWCLPDRAVLLAQRWRVQWPVGCWFGDSHRPGCHLLASKEGYWGRIQGTDTLSGQAAPDSLQKSQAGLPIVSSKRLPQGLEETWWGQSSGTSQVCPGGQARTVTSFSHRVWESSGL